MRPQRLPSGIARLGLPRNVLRSSGADRVTHVELFFDLVFVFALTQLSSYLFDHRELLGALEGAILLCAVWWTWVSTTWVTNTLDPAKLPVRVAVIALAFLALLMAVATKESFGDRAWTFAVAYVALQLGRTAFIVWATMRHDRRIAHDFTCILIWTAAGSVLWIVGALLPLPTQLPLWIAALGLELVGTVLGFRVPGWGGVSLERWDLSGAHIAERTSLFVLIAIGEGLLVTGFAFVAKESSPESVIAMACAFVTAAATWWIYFDHGERVGAEAIEESDAPGRLARIVYTWVHLLIVGGIVMLSVGDKQALSHPHEHGAVSALTTTTGPFLFLVGTVVFRRLLEGRMPRAQLAGAVAMAGVWVFGLFAIALTTTVVVTAVLVAVAAGETIERVRRGRRAGG
ncbi:low temperature requirement protein A [Microbacterium sp. JZ70]